MGTFGLLPSRLDPFVFAMGLRGESRISRRPVFLLLGTFLVITIS